MEHDVYIEMNGTRDSKRIIAVSNSKNNILYDYIYYTKDHYENFIHITPK